MFDIIGDIHGHAQELIELLEKLGYKKNNGIYSHQERKALFVGDYIDRGNRIADTLEIVKSMVDSDNAIALMGNHEYNAICFNTESKNGGYLREHSKKNIMQHYQMLEQFKDNPYKYNEYINWFKTLPLFYETDDFRAVHACWDTESIKYLQSVLNQGKYLTDDLIIESSIKDSKLFDAIEIVLKGKELKLSSEFKDSDGNQRKEMRIKWWLNPATTPIKELSFNEGKRLPNIISDIKSFPNKEYYTEDSKPVFFGHYWQQGETYIHQKNVCGVDFSIAKEGKLVAYRYNMEKVLDKNNMVEVK